MLPDQLTSVRFDRDTLDALRLLADLNETNIATEVREAVRRYIKETTTDPDFSQRLETAEANRRKLVDDLLASTRE